jgi:hypothetical protein
MDATESLSGLFLQLQFEAPEIVTHNVVRHYYTRIKICKIEHGVDLAHRNILRRSWQIPERNPQILCNVVPLEAVGRYAKLIEAA